MFALVCLWCEVIKGLFLGGYIVYDIFSVAGRGGGLFSFAFVSLVILQV